jgi:hypothetical protein
MADELVFVLAHEIVRMLNADDGAHRDTDMLPVLANLRAACRNFNGAVKAAIALLERVLLPSDGALLAHPQLLPALKYLSLSRAWRNVPPAMPVANVSWVSLRSVCVSDCRWVSAAWLGSLAVAAPNVVALIAARCKLDDAMDDATGGGGAALLPWAPKLLCLNLSGATVSTRSLTLLLPACRRLRVLVLDGGVCRVERVRTRQPDGTYVNKYTKETTALFNALRRRAPQLEFLDLSSTPSLRGVPLAKILDSLPPGAFVELDGCNISEQALEELMEALPECVIECGNEMEATTKHADAVHVHARPRRCRSTHGAVRAVRCDWDVFQRVLASDVVEKMANTDQVYGDASGVALLSPRVGFIAHMDSLHVGDDGEEWETADLAIQFVTRAAPGAAWACNGPLRHNAIEFDAQHEEDHDACMLGRFRKQAIADALNSAVHDCFFAVGEFTRMRLFSVAVPQRYVREYEPVSDTEECWAPHCQKPRTKEQDAQRGGEMLEWAAAAEEARFLHPERFDPAPPHPPWYVNPQLMAVVDPPGRINDAVSAWQPGIADGTWRFAA